MVASTWEDATKYTQNKVLAGIKRAVDTEAAYRNVRKPVYEAEIPIWVKQLPSGSSEQRFLFSKESGISLKDIQQGCAPFQRWMQQFDEGVKRVAFQGIDRSVFSFEF